MRLLITGGAGFIGANFIRLVLEHREHAEILNLDKLTYAGNLENLASVSGDSRYRFVRGDIANEEAVQQAFSAAPSSGGAGCGFDAIVNFAAETHVDRSIEDANPFLRTNVFGTHVLLEAARRHRIPRFVQISTDEVYGSAASGRAYTEQDSLQPASPYAASKAAADLLVRANVATYGVPAIVIRCTNNFGPCQFPEKLIPLVAANALEDKPVPVYGDGLQERDWLFVEDCCAAILRILERGRDGEIYNVAAGHPLPNLLVIETILRQFGKPQSLIQFVQDRPGHDRRYALDSTKVRHELGWAPEVRFEDGIRKTLEWYQVHSGWLARARSGEYRQYYQRHYTERESTLQKIAPATTT